LREIADGLDFKMPRPQSLWSEFDLSDREVELTKPAKVAVAGNAVEHKLLPLPDRNKNAKKDSKAISKKASQSQQANGFSVEVIDAAESDWNVSADSTTSAINRVSPFIVNRSNSKKSDSEVKQEKEKINWSELLRSAPTLENAKKLVVALMSGEVTREEFNQVAKELMSDRGTNPTEVGLFLLKAVPSFDSLVQLIDFSSQLGPQERVGLQKSYLNDYAAVVHYGSVARLLATDKKEYLEESLRLIDLILSSSGTPITDSGRTLRVREASVPSLKKDLKVFLEPLKKLSEKQDSPLASLAKNTFEKVTLASAVTENAPRTASEVGP
jgi:hypothetical protein